MYNAMSPGPIVIAIDGSNAAIHAAQWAAKEAVHQDVPLRLVHVIHAVDGPTGSSGAYSVEEQYAESSLRTACLAVRSNGLPVQIETAVLRGEVDQAIIDESKSATLVCLGSTGIGRVAAAVLGSTAATVAERARCPVAIIRDNHDQPPPEAGFIAVILDGRPGSDEAMRWAMEEARVRRAPVLALGTWPWPLFDIDYERFDRHLDHWLKRYPDVKVEVATTRMSAIRYLEGFVGSLQLIVMSSKNADRVIDFVGPRALSLLAHTDCSVLVARASDRSTDCRDLYQRSRETETIAP